MLRIQKTFKRVVGFFNNLTIKQRVMVGIAVILIIVSAGITGYFQLQHADILPATNQQTEPEPPASEKTIEQKPSYRSLYATAVRSESAPGRSYPVYKLWYQDTDKQPVELGEFGKAGDYLDISETLIASTGEKIFLHYDTKIEAVEIETGTVESIWKPQEGFKLGAHALSPRGGSLLAISNDSAPQPSKQVIIERVDLNTNAAEEIYRANQRRGFYRATWRTDDKVILNVSTSADYFQYAVYDLISNTIEIDDRRTRGIYITKDGYKIATSSNYIDHPCNLYSGKSPSTWSIREPAQDTEIQTFEVPGEIIDYPNIDFKDDGSEIYYASYVPAEIDNLFSEKCDTEASLLHPYVMNMQSGSIHQVVNYESAFREWYPDRPYVHTELKDGQCILHRLDGELETADCSRGQTHFYVLETIKLN